MGLEDGWKLVVEVVGTVGLGIRGNMEKDNAGRWSLGSIGVFGIGGLGSRGSRGRFRLMGLLVLGIVGLSFRGSSWVLVWLLVSDSGGLRSRCNNLVVGLLLELEEGMLEVFELVEDIWGLRIQDSIEELWEDTLDLENLDNIVVY